MTKIAILYHKADLDGVLSGVIAYEALIKNPQTNITAFGCDYGDDLKALKLDLFDKIYIIDFSDEWLLTNEKLKNKITLIDHHISCINKNYNVSKYLINGVAACRLTYQFFHNQDYSWLNDIHYINRLVKEPYIVTLAGEHDIWDKESPDAKYLTYGISDLSFSNIQFVWNQLRFVFEKAQKGKDKVYIDARRLDEGYDLLNRYVNGRGEGAIEFISNTYLYLKSVKVNIMGLTGYAYNTNIRSSLIAPQKGDFTMVWCYEGNPKIKVSLYSETVDVSKIAVSLGGGGHRGACGFQVYPHVLTQMLTTGYP
jgi:oligoribonuclease NrnB/cAMP/cGMP phosphodiesterase (DHH superfamily)